MAPVQKSKRNHLSLATKAKILELIEKGITFARIARDYHIGKGTVSRINARKIKIREIIQKSYTGPGTRKYIRESEVPLVEKKLYEWFLSQRKKNVALSSEILKHKAMQISQNIGTPFNASNGWFINFKKRFGIRQLKICGEKLSANPESVSPFICSLKEKIKELELTNDHIYNADETGLFWKILPNKTFVSADEKNAPGHKLAKERVTLLVCTNASGSHKLQPVVIGKSKNPRSFKNIKIPVEYLHSKNAWMNGFLFKKWFHDSFVPQVIYFFIA